MRRRVGPSPLELLNAAEQRAERKTRKEIERTLERMIRFEGLPFTEEGAGRCESCARDRVRRWHRATWVPRSARAQHIGWIVRGPRWCAPCTVGRVRDLPLLVELAAVVAMSAPAQITSVAR